ncbi:hypothetical protein EKM02_12790 [Flavobacterium sp. RSP49]|uniref:hypothetical protein n=1 Tax=Flavobacterium sp. RSP49 TaxID=2497487 RepID=UPI000F84AFDD|nr:hypothetical protein [Flavobacterium sp. RSP49]RTY98007.1 hypothetical protein EKM02_12790 [Flavobacterium sp. RSP49]
MKNIILLFLFSINLISAQETQIDSIVSKQIKYLTENKTSEFFIVEKYCNGCIKLIKANEPDCDYGTSRLYVFWKDKSQSYFRKLGKCNSPKIKIPDEIIKNYILNINEIEKENIKGYQTGKDSFVSVSHSTFSTFYFMYNGNLIVKQFNDFDLTTEDYSTNINYDYNNSLKLIKLSEICDKIILKKQ